MQRSWLRLFWLTVVLIGAIAGYLVSSGLGTRLLHREIETQLSRLLEGPVEIGVVDLRLEDGFHLEARDLSAFPGARDESPPVLRARRILAWIDPLALLIGRLELSTLVFEGPHLRLVQNEDGSLAGLPLSLERAYPDDGLDDRSGPEQFFARLASLEPAATQLAGDFEVADVIEVIDGTLEWVAASSDVGTAPAPLRIELLNGVAERHWLSEAIAIESRGVFIDGVHAPFPFEFGLHREEGAHFIWSLSISQIPLDAALLPFPRIEAIAGTLSTRFHLYTARPGVHRLRVEGEVEDASISLERSGVVLDREKVDLAAEFVIDPIGVRLVSSNFAGPNLDVAFKGSIQRPIGPLSATRVEARTEGIELAAVRRFAGSFEGQSETALTINRLTERVETGRVKYIEIAGSATLRRWQDFLSGRATEIPAGFVLGGAFDRVSVLSGPEDRLEDISGEVEWIGDQIVFRNGRGKFHGRPLPQIDAVINGMDELVRTSASARRITTSPPPLDGLDPLFEILKPRNPDALPPVSAIGLSIDSLEHPVFRWPFRNLKVLIEPLRRGLEVTVRDGLWGGARVEGEVVWFNDPKTPSVSATLTLSDPSLDAPGGSVAVSPPSRDADAIEAGRWGSGEFEMKFRPRRWLPFETATGFLRLEETRAYFDELDVLIKEQGTMAARMELDLDRSDTVGFDISFALTGARMDEVGPFVALPDDLTTGSIDGSGSLKGRVRPDTNFIAELKGGFQAVARNGRVQSKLPLMFRLARATEGYNPFAKENLLPFETMTGTFAIDHGVLSVEDFEIEGPLRVYAQADIDTNDRPATIRAVVGIFLFRKPNQLLESLPLIRSFLPGSERGLIGTYFEVNGALDEPDVEALPVQTLMSSVPDVIKAPFQVLRRLFEGDDG